jgi:hypothetical protein
MLRLLATRGIIRGLVSAERIAGVKYGRHNFNLWRSGKTSIPS